MTQANTARRARLDALLDQGGLDQASAADREWLASERARDASFDHEVQGLLRAEAHLREWGTHMGGAGQTADEALSGILAGLDAGLYDDDLELDRPPRFADGDGDVVALGSRPASAVAVQPVEAVAAAGPAAAPSQLGAARPRILRDGRFMQVLAAAAALVLVVTAGLSMVSVSSAPGASESAVLTEPRGPEPMPSAAPVAPPSVVAPSEPMPAAEAEFADDAQAHAASGAAAAPSDGRLMVGGGYGGEGALSQASPSRPSGTAMGSSAGGVPAEARPHTQAPASETVELMAMQADAPPPVARPTFAAEAPAADDAATRGASRQPGATRTASADIAPAPRYTTQSAMQQAMNQCITAPRVVTYQVASRTGLVQVLSAPGAAEAELSCLRGVAARTTVTPAPGVARRQQVTLRAVSDRSAQ